MKINPILLLAITAIGMFALGAILTEGRMRRIENRQLIKEIKAEQKKINYKIDSIYAKAIDQERLIINKIENSYDILKDIAQKKGSVHKNYTQQKDHIEQQEIEIEDLKANLGREFIFVPKQEKN